MKTQTSRPQLSFPLLRDEEILQLLHDLQFYMSQKELNEPNAETIRHIYATIFTDACGLLPTSEQVLANYDLVSECCRISYYGTHSVSLYLLTLFNYMRQILPVCKVHDFSFADILVPLKKRFVLFFSALTNFLRFKSMVNEIIYQHIDQFAKNRSYEDIDKMYLQSQRNQLMDLQQRQAEARQAVQQISQQCYSKMDVIQQQIKEYYQVTATIYQKQSEANAKERENNNMQRNVQQITQNLAQIYRKIIDPEISARYKAQNEQFAVDILTYQNRIYELYQKVAETQAESLVQQEVDQTLASIVSVYHNNQQQQLQLQDMKQQLEIAQLTVQQYEEEKQEIVSFDKQCQHELYKLNLEENELSNDQKSKELFNTVLQYDRQLAEIQGQNFQLEEEIYLLAAQNESLMRGRNYIKADVLKKQESMVDQLNLLIKGYCVYMQEMTSMFE